MTRSFLVVAFVAIFSSPSLSQVVSGTIDSPYNGIKGPNGFGADAAQSGETLLIGSPFVDEFRGAVDIFQRRVDGSWEHSQVLHTRSDLLLFGSAVDIDGDRALISAPFNEDWEIGKGEVIVVERRANEWVEVDNLRSEPDESFFGYFPDSIAIDGDMAVVGAGPVDGRLSGSVYVYATNGSGQWELRQHLLSPNGPNTHDDFGRSVDLDNGRLIVGAPDRLFQETHPTAHIYALNESGQWELEQSLDPNVPRSGFGWIVRLHGDIAVCSAPFDGTFGEDSGLIFVYERSQEGSWNEIGRLHAKVPFADDRFGYAMEVDEGRLMATLSGWNGEYGAEVIDLESGKLDRVAEIPFSPDHNTRQVGTFEDNTVALLESRVDDFTSTRFLLADVTYAGRPLETLPFALSLSEGGRRDMYLDGGAEQSGALYLVLGSASGNEPGLPLEGGWTLPLNPDFYFQLTLTLPNLWPVENSLGILDDEGRATAAFWVPPGAVPSLSGTTLHHAFLTFDPKTDLVTFVSDSVEFSLVD